MTQPICRFVREYADAHPLRLHMPGHKGKTVLGPEALDITEIAGGIIIFTVTGKLYDSVSVFTILKYYTFNNYFQSNSFVVHIKHKPVKNIIGEKICKPSSVIEGSHLSRPAVAGRLKPPVGYAPSERALLHPVGVAPGRVYMAAQSPVRR